MKKNYNIKIVIVSLFAAVFALNPTNSHSMPAAPHFIELQQSDGTKFPARQWGDEHSHGWETDTGHTIVHDQSSKSWTYAVKDKDGKLTSSSILVQKSYPPPVDIQKNLRPLKVSPIQVIGKSTAASSSLPQLAAPVTGTKSLPVILIGFTDAPFTKTKENFDNLLFGSTGNTMKNYYLQNSYNQLTVNGGASGVYGPVTANNTQAYYGGNDANGDDKFPGTLVYEAVSKAAANGFKFAPFVDQTKSCYVDVVMIAHQGTGEEASFITPNDIWSHSWDLNSAQSNGHSSNGEFVTNEACTYPGGGGFIKVNNYVIQPELATPNPNGLLIGVGVYAHEYGHAIGLPDLYDTDYSSEGAGDWTLMAGGSWLGPQTPFVWNGSNYTKIIGDSPAHLDAWSKYYLGWISPTNISGVSSNQPVTAASSASPNFYVLGTGTPTSGEYFLVENRQKSGFDSYLNGSGLLVWHIDGTTISGLFPSNAINNNECISSTLGACSGSSTHFGVTLIQADNYKNLENGINSGDATDPFYSPKTFSDATAPNSKLWNGTASSVSISAISASATTMTATFSIAPQFVDGACGASHNQPFTVAPTVSDNLCDSGTPSTVSGSGPWAWTCGGSNGGTTASCWAYATSQQVTFWTQNFDGVSAPALPAGWSTNGSGTGLWQSNVGTKNPSGTAAHSPSNLVYFNSYTVSSGVTAFLASPAFSLTGKLGGKVSFWMYRDSGYTTNADLVNVYVNTTSNLTGAQLLGTVNRYINSAPVVVADGWYKYTFDIPDTFTSATNYLLINGVSAYGNDIHIDDISAYAFTTSYPLTFAFAGTGYGSVNSVPAGIACTGTAGDTCAPKTYTSGTAVTLTASPNASSSNYSTFSGWFTNTTACPGYGNCSVTMNSPVSVSGYFTRDKLVKNSSTSLAYNTIYDAFQAAASGQIIQVRDNSGLTPFTDALTVTKSVTLKGGFAAGFGTNTGYTTSNGKLTIGNGGALRVERLVIK